MTLLVFRGEHVVSSRASVKEKRRRLIAPNWRFDDAIDTPNQKDRNGKQNDVASDFEDFSAQRGSGREQKCTRSGRDQVIRGGACVR